jgi:hypothetical protein
VITIEREETSKIMSNIQKKINQKRDSKNIEKCKIFKRRTIKIERGSIENHVKYSKDERKQMKRGNIENHIKYSKHER